MTNRRNFLAAIAALGALNGARAQSPAGPRIGWIAYSPPGATLDAFQDGMRALGYVDKRAVGVEVRVVEANPDRVRAAIEELRQLNVALIITQAGAAPVVHRINAGLTPLLFAYSGDPVVAGMVESFARPGGNTTGVSFFAFELVGKRFEVLKEIAPSIRRVAIIANPQHPGEKAERRVSLEAAERLGMQTSYFEMLPGANPDAVFDLVRQARVQALIVFPDGASIARSGQIAEFALKERLLALSGWSQFARAGFLATYGPNLSDSYRRLATFVDRILKGARADSLPVELPTRIELVVNTKTAKALGVTIPQAMLLRADEVIQ
jgi:putative ABC transport system substrate-binding protein